MLLLFSSCEKDNRRRIAGAFDTSIEIPAGLNLIETHIFTIRGVPTLYANTIVAQNADTSMVEEILPSKCILRTPFWNDDLDFLERISIRAKPSLQNTSFKEMFYLDPVPFNRESPLNLFNGIADQKQAIEREFVDVEVRIKLRSFVPTSLRIDLNLGYQIVLKE